MRRGWGVENSDLALPEGSFREAKRYGGKKGVGELANSRRRQGR
jgi:hypothetical protein